MPGAYQDLALSLNPIHYWDLFVAPASGTSVVQADLGSLGQDLEIRHNAGVQSFEEVHQPGPSVCSFSLWNESPTVSAASTNDLNSQVNENCLPGDFTVIAWVNIDPDTQDQTFRVICSNEVIAVAPDFHWALFCGGTIAQPRVGCRLFTGGTTTHMDTPTVDNAPPNEWLMCVGRFDSAAPQLDFFLNGALDASDTTASGSRNATEPQGFTVTSFVSTPDLNYWGYISLVSAFDYQLTDENIADLYTAGHICLEEWDVSEVF